MTIERIIEHAEKTRNKLRKRKKHITNKAERTISELLILVKWYEKNQRKLTKTLTRVMRDNKNMMMNIDMLIGIVKYGNNDMDNPA